MRRPPTDQPAMMNRANETAKIPAAHTALFRAFFAVLVGRGTRNAEHRSPQEETKQHPPPHQPMCSGLYTYRQPVRQAFASFGKARLWDPR